MTTGRGVLVPLLWAALLCGSLTACEDLGVPDLQGDGGTLAGATGVELLGPDAQAVQPQAVTVRVRITDVNGVRGATLSCGDAVLASWQLTGADTEVVLERRVDLTPCRPEALGAASGTAPVALRLLTEEGTGVRQVHTLALQVLFGSVASGGSAPRLTLEHAARVGAGQPITVRIVAADPLAGPPTATLDGVPMAVRAEAGADAGVGGAWVAELPAGLPLQQPGAPALDVFANERAAALQVSAPGGTGATAQVAATLTVSRLLWERALPGNAYAEYGQGVNTFDRTGALRRRTTQAVPTDAGLVVPVVRGDRTDDWRPVRMDPRSGAIQTLPADVLAARVTYRAVAVDGQGRVLLEDPQRLDGGLPELRRITDPLDGGVVVQVPVGGLNGLAPVNGGLCRTRTIAAAGTGVCPASTATSTVTFECLDDTTGVLRQVGTAVTPVNAGADPVAQLSSAGTFVGGMYAFDSAEESGACCFGCTRALTFGTADAGLWTTSSLSPPFSSGESFYRLLPDRQGAFALVLRGGIPFGGIPPPWAPPERTIDPMARTVFLYADGGTSSNADAGVPGVNGRDTAHLLGVAPGSVVVLVETDEGRPQLQLRGWRPGGLTPVWQASLPGVFIPLDLPGLGDPGDPGDTTLFEADGSGVALLRRPNLPEVWALGFGPALQPRWAYRLPTATSRARLYPMVGDGTGVYVLDTQNGLVFALAR